MARIHGRSFRNLFVDHNLFINALLVKFNENKANGENFVSVEWIIENVLTDIPGFPYVLHYFQWKKPNDPIKASILHIFSFTNSLRKKGFIVPPIKFPFGIVDSKHPVNRKLLNAYIFNGVNVEFTGIIEDDSTEFGFRIETEIQDFSKQIVEDSGFLPDESPKQDDLDLSNFAAIWEESFQAIEETEKFQDRSADKIHKINNPKFGAFVVRDKSIRNQNVPVKGMPEWKRKACKYMQVYNKKQTSVRKLKKSAKPYLDPSYRINPFHNFLMDSDIQNILGIIGNIGNNTKLTTVISRLSKADYVGRDYSIVLKWYINNIHIDMTWSDLLVVLQNNPYIPEVVEPAIDHTENYIVNHSIVKTGIHVPVEVSPREKSREICADFIRNVTKQTNLWLECVSHLNNCYIFECVVLGRRIWAVGNTESCIKLCSTLDKAKGYCI